VTHTLCRYHMPYRQTNRVSKYANILSLSAIFKLCRLNISQSIDQSK